MYAVLLLALTFTIHRPSTSNLGRLNSLDFSASAAWTSTGFSTGLHFRRISAPDGPQKGDSWSFQA